MVESLTVLPSVITHGCHITKTNIMSSPYVTAQVIKDRNVWVTVGHKFTAYVRLGATYSFDHYRHLLLFIISMVYTMLLLPIKF